MSIPYFRGNMDSPIYFIQPFSVIYSCWLCAEVAIGQASSVKKKIGEKPRWRQVDYFFNGKLTEMPPSGLRDFIFMQIC
jgi:hypothetical protein